MARTPSNMVSLGTKAPDFSLFDVVSEESKNLNDLKGKNGSVIMFISLSSLFLIVSELKFDSSIWE